jgi:ribosomal protein L13E
VSDYGNGCWGIRTSKEKHDLIGRELARGRLRQGWGSRDLREIGRRVEAGTADDDMYSIWKYTQRMLDIRPGDLVLTPHQPDRNRNGVWRVTRGYDFDPIPDAWEGQSDFGHVLLVEPIGVINHRNSLVDSALRRALTSGFRSRMRQLHDYRDTVLALVDNPAARHTSDAAEHFDEVRRQAREALGQALLSRYGNADFERPVAALLESLYPDAVSHTAGPAERGRDFVVEDVDSLGLTRTVIVQVKSWSGPISQHSLMNGLRQLATGIEAQAGEVDLAVLLTLGELPADADKTILRARERTGVPTRVLSRDETLDLLLDHIADMRL